MIKAAYKSKTGCVIRDLQLRPLKAGEVRLKILACGICGTDLQTNGEESAEGALFGHEMAGIILEMAPDVYGFSIGQEVVVESATPCGRCSNCRNARQELCTDIQSFFYLGYFGFAQECIVPAISLISCDGCEPAVACLSEPLGVAIDLVKLGQIEPTSNVLILGQGPIGLMALALVKRAGARRIFAGEFSDRKARYELAKKFGADAVIDPRKTPLAEYDFGCEIDRILVTTPPKTLNDAFEIATKGAIISFIGIDHGPNSFCNFNVNDFHFKKLQLRASFASPALYTPLAMQFLREGVVDGEAIISHRLPLSRINEAMTIARDDPSAVKVMILPQA